MDAENQNPTQPAPPDPNQPGPATSPLPDSPLGPGSAAPQPSTPPAPQQHPLDAPAPRPVVDSLQNQQPFVTHHPDTSQPAPEEQTKGAALTSIASGFSSILGAIFSWVIFPVAVVLILHNFVFQAYHVLGTSMVPTLHETDYLIISKVGYTQALVERFLKKDKIYLPARGQVIVFRYPKDPTKVFVKRVVGLPGDRVVIKNGAVTVFDKTHPGGFDPDKGYEKSDAQTLIDTDEVVQDGNVFVMGDNRAPGGSYDSREWGELPSSYIIGNAVLRLLPLDQVRVL
jgi:signal peptidase I